jgi:hypothetical protein
MIFGMIAPMMPFYLAQVKAKLEVDIDQEDVTALMDLPQAEMAKANVHQFLSGMSPWGTLDDLELIRMTENDANEYVPCVWQGIEGRENFESPMQAVDAFFGMIKPNLVIDFEKSDHRSLPEIFGLGDIGRYYERRLFAHVASLIMGDEIEIEVGLRPFPNVEKYDKLLIRGAGLGAAIKAGMVVINQ